MSGIGSNYAQALYSLAKEENLTGVILQELQTLAAAFAQEPEFLRLLSAPNLSKDTRVGIVDESFRGKVQPYVLNFLKLLTEKGHIRSFFDCVKVYHEQYNEDNGIVCVEAVSAVALTQTQQEKLRQKLESITGKRIELANRVDATCIGGMRLDYDGKRVDGTVQNRLESMGELLRNTVI